MSEKRSKRKRSGSFTVLLGLLVAGLVSVALAGRLGRYWWAADLLTHFTVYQFVAGVVLTPLVLVLGRRRLAAVSAACLLVNAALLWPQWVPAAPEGSLTGTGHGLVLTHINVQRGNRDRDRVVNYIKACGADAVFVQEADPWWVKTLDESDIPYRVALSRSPPGAFGIMLLVSDRGPQSAGGDSRFVSAGLVDMVSTKFDRPAIEAVFELEGQTVTVLSIHPPPPVSAARTAERNGILRDAKRWADRQNTEHIVIGDLNTTPWSHAFSILVGDGRLISTLDGRGNQGTWPTTRRVPWMIPIDHCLHSSRLICLDRSLGGELGSDHLPLTLTLGLISDEDGWVERGSPAYVIAPESHK